MAMDDPTGFVASIGMIDYITNLITVIGVFVLSIRPPFRAPGSTLAFNRTVTVNVIKSCCISPLIVGRSAAEHLMGSAMIEPVFGGGLLIHRSSWRWRITQQIDA